MDNLNQLPEILYTHINQSFNSYMFEYYRSTTTFKRNGSNVHFIVNNESWPGRSSPEGSPLEVKNIVADVGLIEMVISPEILKVYFPLRGVHIINIKENIVLSDIEHRWSKHVPFKSFDPKKKSDLKILASWFEIIVQDYFKEKVSFNVALNKINHFVEMDPQDLMQLEFKKENYFEIAKEGQHRLYGYFGSSRNLYISYINPDFPGLSYILIDVRSHDIKAHMNLCVYPEISISGYEAIYMRWIEKNKNLVESI